jgi:hypothetical protein
MNKFITLKGGYKMQKIVYNFLPTQCPLVYLALMESDDPITNVKWKTF